MHTSLILSDFDTLFRLCGLEPEKGLYEAE